MKKKKFRYNVTLINLSLVLFMIYLLYINSLFLIFVFGYSFPILLIDFILQAYFKNNKQKLFISNIIFIVIIILILWVVDIIYYS